MNAIGVDTKSQLESTSESKQAHYPLNYQIKLPFLPPKTKKIITSQKNYRLLVKKSPTRIFINTKTLTDRS